jgi:hypothetical protein
MTSQILMVLLGALSALATVSGIAYIIVRLRTLSAYRTFIETEGDPEKAAREVYHCLDRRQKRLAIVILSIYGLTFIVLSPFLQPASGLMIGCMILVTLAALSVGLTASVCNDKETEARINADSRRRIRRFRAPTPPASGPGGTPPADPTASGPDGTPPADPPASGSGGPSPADPTASGPDGTPPADPPASGPGGPSPVNPSACGSDDAIPGGPPASGSKGTPPQAKFLTSPVRKITCFSPPVDED